MSIYDTVAVVLLVVGGGILFWCALKSGGGTTAGKPPAPPMPIDYERENIKLQLAEAYGVFTLPEKTRRKFVYCSSLGDGVLLECHDDRVEWILPNKQLGTVDDVYIELAIKDGECFANHSGLIVRAHSARCVRNSHLYWIDGKFSFIKDDLVEHGLHPTHVLLLITDPRAVEHTYLNLLTRPYRQQFRDALQAMREHGVYLVDAKSNEHTVDLEFNSIVFTVSKGE